MVTPKSVVEVIIWQLHSHEDVELVTLSCSAFVQTFKDTTEYLFIPENLCNINNNNSATQLQSLVENNVLYSNLVVLLYTNL
jgi:hypothetical protein